MKFKQLESSKDFSKIGDPNFFTPEEAIACAISDTKLRDEVYSRQDVLDFLKNIPLSRAIQWGNKIDRWTIWQVILGRPDVNFEKAKDCAESQHSSAVWQIVLERKDMQEYLNNLSVEEAIEYAKKSERLAVQEFIYSRKDVQDHNL